MLQATCGRPETFLHGPLWLAKRLAQALPLSIVSHRNGDPSALTRTRIDVVRCHAGMVIAQRACGTLDSFVGLDHRIGHGSIR